MGIIDVILLGNSCSTGGSATSIVLCPAGIDVAVVFYLRRSNSAMESTC